MDTKKYMEFVGKTVGNYSIKELSDKGGFGYVYKGVHTLVSEDYAAIKILRTDLLNTCKEQFLKEATYLSQLNRHPHIVSYRDYGEKDDHPFLVMEYVSSGNLRKHHEGKQEASLATVVSYVQQIASALQYIHNHGIIHCDIRLEHILIGENQDLLLCDFGMAVNSGEPGFIPVGRSLNEKYMAPEQIQKKNLTFATDQYTLAVVVCELLLDRHLFEEFAENDDKEKNLPDNMNVPRDVRKVLRTALNTDPNERYESIEEFARELSAASGYPFTSNILRNQPELDDSSSKFSDPHRKKRSISRRSFLEIASVVTTGAVGVLLLESWLKFGSEASGSSIHPSSSPFPPGYTFNVYHGHIHTDKKVDGNVNGVAWSPDGVQIASASFDHTVQVWDALNGDHLMIYNGYTAHVNDVAWSPDGNYIASCSGQVDINDFIVRVWDVSTGQPFPSFNGHTDIVNAVAWSPDSQYVASASFDRTIVVSNAVTGNQISGFSVQLEYEAYTVAWSPDGQYIAVASDSDKDSTVYVWQFPTGNKVSTYRGHKNGVLSLAWLPGKSSLYIASGSKDNMVKVWDALTGNDANLLYPPRSLNGSVRIVAWSPSNGKYIAAGTSNGTIEVWDAQTGQDLLPGGYRHGIDTLVNAVAWSPDSSKIASGGSDATVRVWQVL